MHTGDKKGDAVGVIGAWERGERGMKKSMHTSLEEAQRLSLKYQPDKVHQVLEGNEIITITAECAVETPAALSSGAPEDATPAVQEPEQTTALNHLQDAVNQVTTPLTSMMQPPQQYFCYDCRKDISTTVQDCHEVECNNKHGTTNELYCAACYDMMASALMGMHDLDEVDELGDCDAAALALVQHAAVPAPEPRPDDTLDPTLEPAPAPETLPASAPAPAPTAEATQSPADVQFRVGDFVFTNARYGKKGKKGNELGVDYHVGRVMEVMDEEAHLEFWAIAQDPDGADVPYTYARCPEPYGPREPLGALFLATVLEPPYRWGGELVVELDTREMEQKMQKEMDELDC